MQFYKTSVLAFGTTSLETAERMNHLAEQWRKCWKRLIDDIYIHIFVLEEYIKYLPDEEDWGRIFWSEGVA